MNASTIRASISPPQKNAINHLLNKFIGNPHVDSVFLFGSCAKGISTDKSDIDIFVVTNSKIYDDSHEAFNVLYGAADDIPLENYVSCDILTATRDEFQLESTPLIKVVKKEGVKLHELL